MALLPGRPHSDWFYRKWKERFEFIIHMPMEPEDYPREDPGKLALLVAMSPDQIVRRVDNVLDRYPAAVGLNNHMGSAFTQHRPGMSALMKVLARRDLFYLDSRTSRDSLGVTAAHGEQVPVVSNQVFLDHERRASFVRRQLDRLVSIARQQGTAIGIGHIQSEVTARVLSRRLPHYRREGVTFVPLSQVVAARTG